MKKISYKILKTDKTTNLPLFLESEADELGVMVGFDGDILQIDQLCNFWYTQTGRTVEVTNTVNPNKLKKISEATFNLNWGDGNTSIIPILSSVSHTYNSDGEFTLSLSTVSPWSNQRVVKKVVVPSDVSVNNPLGEITIPEISAYEHMTGQTQQYLVDVDNFEHDIPITFTYMSIGQSRLDELKEYGTFKYLGTTTGVTDNQVWVKYTIDDLQYQDFSDGFTMITGTTEAYTREEVINHVITRNEHFIGFIDEPTVYSDIFVERGKMGVSEKNLRLSEIDSIGELTIYGNGYFTIKKQ